MADRRGVVAVPVREQSEIFESRRKVRRARIDSTHAEVRAILHGDEYTYPVTVSRKGKVTIQHGPQRNAK